MQVSVVSISSHPLHKQRFKGCRKRVFYLGYHAYSGGPGCCWSACYWVKNVYQGQRWEIYLSSDGSYAYRNRQYNGTYSVQELIDYFECVEFELEEDEWRAIGLGLSECVQLTDLDMSTQTHGI